MCNRCKGQSKFIKIQIKRGYFYAKKPKLKSDSSGKMANTVAIQHQNIHCFHRSAKIYKKISSRLLKLRRNYL